MRISFSRICFLGKPDNYAQIDKYISRSAQPKKEDLVWLKEQGVTDVFNFRTTDVYGNDYDEKAEVEKLGMKYHHIPTHTTQPNERDVERFLSEADEVILNNGKAHIHCQAGADRTGMYSYIYKAIKGLGDKSSNFQEMIYMGHDYWYYPDLLPWIHNYLRKLNRD